MYAEFKGKQVIVRQDNGVVKTRIYARKEVVSAHVSGDNVIVNMVDGKADVWTTRGQCIRRG